MRAEITDLHAGINARFDRIEAMQERHQDVIAHITALALRAVGERIV